MTWDESDERRLAGVWREIDTLTGLLAKHRTTALFMDDYAGPLTQPWRRRKQQLAAIRRRLDAATATKSALILVKMTLSQQPAWEGEPYERNLHPDVCPRDLRGPAERYLVRPRDE